MRLLLLYVLLSFNLTIFAQDSVSTVLKKHNNQSVPYVKATELKKSNFIILDSREPKEYQVSHIPNAIHVGFDHFQTEKITHLIKNRKTPILVYCSIGVRSEKIGEKLQNLGYTNVHNLYGGIFEYKNNGGTVVNQKNNATDSIHTYNKEWSVYLKKGIKIYEN
ncbi:rhodanese-like domain-containing protein [Flavobacterium sp. 7A]|uniref:rhodanese-like domain-containing protein n=1 Tax=Flavobacterium sp. 7A TaxID=2940571 RepID=UPI0022265576|nr:rhodanese-like domain-containing protein [Flavobacterium sp. 7A]MCW2118790.1 rhodanese-related sulfurtransferase [Flavobacterium sp. 7A]